MFESLCFIILSFLPINQNDGFWFVHHWLGWRTSYICRFGTGWSFIRTSLIPVARKPSFLSGILSWSIIICWWPSRKEFVSDSYLFRIRFLYSYEHTVAFCVSESSFIISRVHSRLEQLLGDHTCTWKDISDRSARSLCAARFFFHFEMQWRFMCLIPHFSFHQVCPKLKRFWQTYMCLW